MTTPWKGLLASVVATAAILGPLRTAGAADTPCPGEPCPAVNVNDTGPCVATGAHALYERRATLQETLLATRQRYSAWLVEQPAAVKAVEFGPWSATPPLPVADAEKQVRPAAGVDLGAKLPDGRALWTPRKDLVDGKAVKLAAGSANTALFVTRSITAKRPVRLTVGIGGGDRLDVWLTGRKVTSAATHITSGRYGCSYRFDDTRVDQVLVDLNLKPGDNPLVLRLTPSEEPSFYFTASPRPVPRLWQWVRGDFPAADNPILDLVPADWFDARGWFAAHDASLEAAIIDRLAADGGEQGSLLAAELARLREAKADRDDRRWLDLCVKGSMLATLRRDVMRLRAAVEELGRSLPGDYHSGELLAELADYEGRLNAQARGKLDPAEAATRGLMAEMAKMRRRMLVDFNPLVRDAEILFVKRPTYDSKHYYDDFQHISRWGGNLCVLSLADGRVREIVPQMAGGVFDRYDLSFDARRIAFGYRRPKPEGFRIYEIGVDGSGLRRLTHPPADEERRVATYGTTSKGDSFYGSMGYGFWTDDVHPCYLPDGGLCFASTRCEHGVLCTPAHYLACTNLFRINADGGDLRPLSEGALSEFTPTMMEDGRILYNRWEYVYKGIAAVQPLWTMRPDGSGGEEFYGDNVANPGVLWQARQVPGHPRLAVCIGCGHEPLGIGPVLLLDINKNKRTPEPITSLTPGTRTQNLRGLYQLRNGVWREDIYGPFYADPYPLSDTFFLVSCNPDRRYNDPSAYGIYLLDAFGNRVPIYSDPEMSCWEPMPLRPRERPPILSPQHEPSPAEPAVATLFLSDVYRGLPGVERGTVKYLRVMEQVPKPWSAEVDLARGEDRTADGFGGHLAISWNAHIWVAVLRGIVPVEEDGSACFEVPARRNLFFQALDADFMQVQGMRTFVNLEPGERRSCIGCHEHRTQAPESRPTLAIERRPRRLSPQPGETAPRPLYYPTDVQPILDRHCVRCHDGHDPKAAPDLRGELTTIFNRSYENLLQGGQVDAVREWNGGTYAMQNAETVPPYGHGSHRSKLAALLEDGHYDAQLSREEWIKLVTWIDCGAPYYGSYFGRRNLRYQGDPDFRPVPTVSSACGVPPEPPKLVMPDPLPAKLLAWWPVDGNASDWLEDASDQGHAARLVGAAKTAGHDGHGALRFDGTGYVESIGLGTHDAVSIAMWVKADSLDRHWNPLSFGSDIRPGIVHFSLLEDGTPNVAICTGERSWTHRRAAAALSIGRWHHVALACDARRRGRVRFYVDGRPAGDEPLGLGIRLNLDRLRLAAWNRWQNTPANNFHGELDDVRIYSGTLTDAEAADLARVSQQPPMK